jgi:2-polyprenyl-6-methoxyphenol hydroxylase-like FAD-dependent oxidoreductase
MIKFEKKGDHIVGHFMTGNNKHTEVKGSCLLACDGIASPTRNSILEDSTNHLGIVSVYGLSYHKLTEELEIGDGHTRCIIKPYDTNRIMWQITFPYTDREIKNPEEVKKIAFFHMVGWAEPIPAIIRNSIKDTIYCSIVYDREPPKQPLEKGLLVTFLGDSAHAISSFESEGANMAMEDASKLVQIASEALRSGDNKRIDEAFRLYEKNMIERSTPVILASRQKTSEMHYRKEHFIHPEPFKWYSKSQGLPSPSMHKKNFVLWDGFDSFFGKWSKTVGFHDPVRKNWKLEDWKNQVDRWMYIEGPCKTSKE